MGERLTKAQRKMLGRGNIRTITSAEERTVWSLYKRGLVHPQSPTSWSVSPAGRAALAQEQSHER